MPPETSFTKSLRTPLCETHRGCFPVSDMLICFVYFAGSLDSGIGFAPCELVTGEGNESDDFRLPIPKRYLRGGVFDAGALGSFASRILARFALCLAQWSQIVQASSAKITTIKMPI
jgi:hypothetical protein